MNYYNIFFVVLILISNGFAQNSSGSEVGKKSLDDVVVKETYEAGAEEEKLPVVLKSDFTNLVEIRERIHWSSVPWTFKDLNPAVALFECKTSVPELVGIIPEPPKVFHVDFKDLANWKLEIFASDGSKFRSLSGEGDPPKSISWNGRGDSGNPLIPGEKYAYSFTAIDKAGNRRTFPGEAFSVPALYLSSDQGVWIGISDDMLFSPNGYGLSRMAENYSDELANLIYYYADEGKIKIQSHHPDMEKFLELLAKKLKMEVANFEQVNSSDPQGDCFSVWVN